MASVPDVVAAVEVDLLPGLDESVVGLRANMSLMLLRLSRSNSGRRRPDAGSTHLFEYSC